MNIDSVPRSRQSRKAKLCNGSVQKAQELYIFTYAILKKALDNAVLVRAGYKLRAVSIGDSSQLVPCSHKLLAQFARVCYHRAMNKNANEIQELRARVRGLV